MLTLKQQAAALDEPPPADEPEPEPEPAEPPVGAAVVGGIDVG